MLFCESCRDDFDSDGAGLDDAGGISGSCSVNGDSESVYGAGNSGYGFEGKAERARSDFGAAGVRSYGFVFLAVLPRP